MFAGLGNSYCHTLLLSYKMHQELKQQNSQIPGSVIFLLLNNNKSSVVRQHNKGARR
jgi:hypothetical protein